MITYEVVLSLPHFTREETEQREIFLKRSNLPVVSASNGANRDCEARNQVSEPLFLTEPLDDTFIFIIWNVSMIT